MYCIIIRGNFVLAHYQQQMLHHSNIRVDYKINTDSLCQLSLGHGVVCWSENNTHPLDNQNLVLDVPIHRLRRIKWTWINDCLIGWANLNSGYIQVRASSSSWLAVCMASWIWSSHSTADSSPELCNQVKGHVYLCCTKKTQLTKVLNGSK